MPIPLLGQVKSKRSRGLLGLLAAGLVAVPVVYGVQQRGQGKNNVDELTTQVQLEDVTQRIRGSGKIQPVRTVNLSPKTAGRIQELLVDQGDRVEQGQVVARMDAQDLVAERNQAAANLAAAQARLETLQNPTRGEAIAQAQAGVDRAVGDIARAQSEVIRAEGEVLRAQGAVGDAESQLGFAGRQLERQKQLASQGAISANNLDEFARKEQAARQTLKQSQAQLAQAQAQVMQAKSQVVQAEAGANSAQAQRDQQNTSGSSGDIKQAEAQVAAAAAQLQAVENRLADTEVRAPFAGVVTQRYATMGAFVTPTTQASSATGTGATSTSIFAIASGLEVLASVPEKDISQIKQGQEVEVLVDAYPKDTFTGKVRLISPEAIEEQNVTKFQVRVELTSGLDKLKSGMNADLNFAGESLKQTLAVPSVAIVTKRGRPGVLVPDKEGKPTFKPVKIGADLDNKTQVLEGLSPGDRFFKELPPGQKLEDILKSEKEKSGRR
jgi:HlyD family secretion protein